MNEKSIFIGGHSRTGTTLMHGLVCLHPDVMAVTREASYFRGLVEAYDLGLRWFDLHTCDFFDRKEDLTDFHRALIGRYLDHVQARFGKGPESIVVQKEPRMTQLFPEIGALLPAARFIVMMRDLRDVIASQVLRHQKAGIAYRLDDDLNRYLQTLRQLTTADGIGDRLIFVQYEALVTRPGEVMERVWRFLGLPTFPVDDHTRWTTKRPREDESASPLDEQPPTAEPIGRNRHVLDADLLRALDGVRELILGQIRYDCYSSDGNGAPGDPVFFLRDIVRNGPG